MRAARRNRPLGKVVTFVVIALFGLVTVFGQFLHAGLEHHHSATMGINHGVAADHSNSGGDRQISHDEAEPTQPAASQSTCSDVVCCCAFVIMANEDSTTFLSPVLTAAWPADVFGISSIIPTLDRPPIILSHA